MKIILAGPGAFGLKHLDGLKNIADVEVVAVVGDDLLRAKEVAGIYGVPHATVSLEEALAIEGVEAAILATPTHMHAAQAIKCMALGKHVQVEIPLADNWQDVQAVNAMQKQTGLVCMVGHTRRFNPSHQWLHRQIQAGEITLQQMAVQTYFFRRENINALGEPRAWTDHLLWHHAAHTVDLFQYQTGEKLVAVQAMQGPNYSELGIAMDMSIQLKSERGKICTLSLSFNNDGPLGTTFRYICDNGTYIVSYDDLVTGNGEGIDVSNMDVSMNGIELQDREFIAAILEGRAPRASAGNVMACYETLHELEEGML